MSDLQRVQREQKQRSTVFVDYFDMDALDALLEWQPPSIVFVTGHADNLPGADVLIDAALARGWRIERYINVAERDGERRLAVTYARGGVRLEVRSAAEWVGPDLHAPLATRAWARLLADLKAFFGERAVLLSSPAQTGLDLLERSLPRRTREDGTREPYTFPTIPDAAQAMLYAKCGQGRLETETFAASHTRPLDRLYVLDGVWMYAACLSNLPSGPLTMDRKSDPPKWAPGFLEARVCVPERWTHIGLLPELYEGDDGQAHRRYPREAGQTFLSTMTTAEYVLAVARGWDVQITQRYLWQQPTCDPARLWRDKLVSLRERYDLGASRGDVVARALSGTVRRLLLNTVGLWFSHQAFTDSYVRREDVAALLQEHPDAHLQVHGRSWFYARIPRQRTAGAAWQHPEWAAQVWGKGRAKLAIAALGLPYEWIAGLRTDGIVSTGDPGWPASSTPGAFRLKNVIEGPLSAPRNEAEMRALLAAARQIGGSAHG